MSFLAEVIKKVTALCQIVVLNMVISEITGRVYKDQLSLTKPRDALHHGKRQNLKTVT